jgi:hypothetical protein
MPPCIVYYSRSGNVRFIAELIAEKSSGTLVPLEEVGRRKGFFGFLKSGFQATTKRPSKLAGDPWSRMSGCERVYLLTPIWGGNASPAVNAFLQRADLTGTRVTVVTLQADPEGRGSDKVHAGLFERVRACGGETAGAYALHSAGPGKFAGEEQLRSEAAKID